MKITNTILIILLILTVNNVYSQMKMTTIVPQPKQAYIREDTKSSFKFEYDFHIYLNEINIPSWIAPVSTFGIVGFFLIKS